ncbi:hypothetical protein LBMAG53_02260 [Planctomycetota bacterium]|nr:hypothetical protein LBMAG53_02260 [Planctomycetota bacterium]
MLRFLIALTCVLSMANSADSVTVVELKDGALTAPTAQPKLVLSEAEWRKRLAPEAFAVLRASGTERPFCGGLLSNKKPGYYVCGGCALPLFASAAKFESGTGWPSFNREVYKGNVERISDNSHGMERVEIRCARCGGHLGHVFNDGPAPTGERHCLNSAALTFVALPPKADAPGDAPAK